MVDVMFDDDVVVSGVFCFVICCEIEDKLVVVEYFDVDFVWVEGL